ncbi:hypothetical protein ASE08_21590 [Rhizobacter sp. Root16D2]|nr:hypothetical protein ASE08_21590 [Rhizobacter sp. Root16D2]
MQAGSHFDFAGALLLSVLERDSDGECASREPEITTLPETTTLPVRTCVFAIRTAFNETNGFFSAMVHLRGRIISTATE